MRLFIALFVMLAGVVQAGDAYNIVWDAPSADHYGSMPLGNGDIGLNAWAQADGTLHVLISKTDAWDENSRLVKVGKVVFRFEPNPFAGKFRQELELQTGSIVFQDKIRLWVDANHPVIHLTTDLPATARIELWRTNRQEIAQLQVSDIMSSRKKPGGKEEPMFIEPDTLVGNTWYHHNAKSVGPEITAKIQGLTGFKLPDPILHRTFGGRAVKTERGFQIFILTQQPATPEQWLAGMDARVRRTGAPDFEAHKRWWADFWSRSWIRATQNTNAPPATPLAVVPDNQYALRVGQDQKGGSKFAGEIRNVRVPTNFTGSFTLEAEVKPARGERGRIFDKITPGKGDGFLLDAHPGNCLRLICGGTQESVKDALPAGQWAHIVAVADAAAGGWRVSVNGKGVIDTTGTVVSDDAAYVSQMYALQRFVNGCAGRGAYPIKFNGSIFTVPHEGDPDYRRWGPGYWWQNTRLPYLSMCASGDFDLMRPLFKMYVEDLLPFCKYRTKLYLGHEGAYYPECIYFWGTVFSDTYGWTPFEQRQDKLQEGGWHKWEWVGGLELCWLLLDYCEHTGDRAFLEKTALPFCREILTFFDQHYQTGPDGKLVMHPAQALETWWDCTNPMPELAGCIAVSERLQALSQDPFYRQFRSKLPALPLREVEGKQALAPAARFEQKHNSENPELYAVFPFRLIAFDKPNLEWGVEALHHRLHKGHIGWRQDDLFMTHLGLAEEARTNLVNRAKQHDKQSRFPAFWGPNYDWTPDQDHGGVLLRTLQTMLMQTDGRKIFLLPAWPKGWDCEFKLHAPHQTTVAGKVVNGVVLNLKVSPESRRQDIAISNQKP